MFNRRLLNDSVLIAAGNFLRLAIQALLLIIVARHLSLNDYGNLVAAVSLVAIAYPLAAVGYEFEVLRSSSNNVDLSIVWQKFLCISVTTTIFLALILIPVGILVFRGHVAFIDLFMLMFSEVFSIRLLEGANRVHQGLGNMRTIVSSRITFFGGRLVFVAIAIPFIEQLTIHTYLVLCTVSALLSLYVILAQLKKRDGLASGLYWVPVRQWFVQLPAALSYGCDRLTTSADKIFLARLSSPAATATYSVACRLIDIVTVPLLAIVTALQPHIFRQSKASPWFLIAIPAIYLLLVSPPLLYFGEAIISFALGEKYAASSQLVGLLLFLPASSFFKYMLTTKSIAAGAKYVMLYATFCAMIINCVINILFIPKFAAIGAILALFSGEIAAIALMAGGLYMKERRGI
jgi:O-antigen/teichoic acid export membrane protein